MPDLEEAEDYYDAAREARDQGDLPRAEELYLTARDLFKRDGKANNEAVCNNLLAFLYMDLDRYVDAERCLLSAKAYFQDNNSLQVARCDQYLGVTYEKSDRLPEAEKLYLSARSLFDENDQPARVAHCDVYLSAMYSTSGRWTEAESRQLLNLEYVTSAGLAEETADSLISLGEIYMNTDKLDEAEARTLSAREIYVENGFDEEVADCDDLLGDVLRRKGLLRDAEARYLAALDFFRENDLPIKAHDSEAGLAIIYKSIEPLEVSAAVAPTGEFPLTNGLYVNEDSDASRFLRFHPNGRVVAVSVTAGTAAAQVARWFGWDHDDRGKYSIHGDDIEFACTNSYGTVEYRGAIVSPRKLVLDIHSRINDHQTKGLQFDFVEVAS